MPPTRMLLLQTLAAALTIVAATSKREIVDEFDHFEKSYAELPVEEQKRRFEDTNYLEKMLKQDGYSPETIQVIVEDMNWMSDIVSFEEFIQHSFNEDNEDDWMSDFMDESDDESLNFRRAEPAKPAKRPTASVSDFMDEFDNVEEVNWMHPNEKPKESSFRAEPARRQAAPKKEKKTKNDKELEPETVFGRLGSFLMVLMAFLLVFMGGGDEA